jgi:ERCC4-related helicase
LKYDPHEYQTYATEYILQHPIAAILLSMGLGKSVITLTAIFDLTLDSFQIRKVLVIAPLRSLYIPGLLKSRSDHLHGLKFARRCRQ